LKIKVFRAFFALNVKNMGFQAVLRVNFGDFLKTSLLLSENVLFGENSIDIAA
jgi:hypothetical protein